VDRTIELNRYDVVGSLSRALDLSASYGHSEYLHHGRRVAYSSVCVGQQMGLSADQLDRLALAGLMHDCGVTTDRSRRAILAFDSSSTEDHCIRGARLIERASTLADLAPIIRSHHDRFGMDNVSGLTGMAIPLEARILVVADRVDVLLDAADSPLEHRAELMERIAARSGDLFDPEVVEAWLAIAHKEAYWFELFDGNDALHEQQRNRPRVSISLDQVEELATIFGAIVDAKSPLTQVHSTGVACMAAELALRLGESPRQAKLARIAGYLHDLGKLGVADELLEKPSALLPDEFDQVKRHSYETYRIIASIRGLEEVAKWASYHHERIDGTGYPFRLRGDQLPLLSKAMCVADVFQALNQDRPYRGALASRDVIRFMREMVRDHALDAGIAELVIDDYDTFHQLAARSSASNAAFATPL
jgi:HD-GYP domain-containing protein (c-di-GMP phosphodiesterase class II)